MEINRFNIHCVQKGHKTPDKHFVGRASRT